MANTKHKTNKPKRKKTEWNLCPPVSTASDVVKRLQAASKIETLYAMELSYK